jgi:hypothetical protein
MGEARLSGTAITAKLEDVMTQDTNVYTYTYIYIRISTKDKIKLELFINYPQYTGAF